MKRHQSSKKKDKWFSVHSRISHFYWIGSNRCNRDSNRWSADILLRQQCPLADEILGQGGYCIPCIERHSRPPHSSFGVVRISTTENRSRGSNRRLKGKIHEIYSATDESLTGKHESRGWWDDRRRYRNCINMQFMQTRCA